MTRRVKNKAMFAYIELTIIAVVLVTGIVYVIVSFVK